MVWWQNSKCSMITIQRLVSALSPSTTDGLRKTLTRRLSHLQEKVVVILGAIDVIPDDNDGTCTLEQDAEQITDIKVDLKDIQSCIFNIENPASLGRD